MTSITQSGGGRTNYSAVDREGNVSVRLGQRGRTYTAHFLITPTTTVDFLMLSGAANKTVEVLEMVCSGLSTDPSLRIIVMHRVDTINGGTVLTPGKHLKSSPAASATLLRNASSNGADVASMATAAQMLIDSTDPAAGTVVPPWGKFVFRPPLHGEPWTLAAADEHFTWRFLNAAAAGTQMVGHICWAERTS